MSLRWLTLGIAFWAVLFWYLFELQFGSYETERMLRTLWRLVP